MVEQFYYKKRVLVTGGSGFIGKHLQKELFNYGAINISLYSYCGSLNRKFY